MYIDRLETKDLIIAKAKIEDTEKIWKNYWSDLESAKYMLWKPTETMEEATNRMERTIKYQADHLAFTIYEKSTNEPIGMAGFFEVEPGVWEDSGIGLGSKFCGKGYGTQIVQVFIDYLFNEMGINKILYSCFRENIASHKLVAKFDFDYLFTIADVRDWDGLEYAVDYFQMLNPNNN